MFVRHNTDDTWVLQGEKKREMRQLFLLLYTCILKCEIPFFASFMYILYMLYVNFIFLLPQRRNVQYLAISTFLSLLFLYSLYLHFRTDFSLVYFFFFPVSQLPCLQKWSAKLGVVCLKNLTIFNHQLQSTGNFLFPQFDTRKNKAQKSTIFISKLRLTKLGFFYLISIPRRSNTLEKLQYVLGNEIHIIKL